MSDWQPEYRPRQTDGRPPTTPPQWQQGAPPQRDVTRGGQPGYGQPETWQQEAYPQPPQWQQPYQPPAPQYQPARHQAPQPQRRRGNGYGPWIAGGAVVLVVIAGAAFYVLHGKSPAPAAAAAGSAAAAQPDTEAGVRSAATAFYAFYSAGQWPQAWAGLSPATQKAVPEATWDAVHQQCTSKTADMAREIKGITMAGSTAVVTETVAGALGQLGTVADAWSYSGGRWGIALPASSTAVFQHGSVKADVAASKAAGDCAS